MLLVLGVPHEWFWWTASRFSPWALGSVIALAATGSVNAWRQLGSLSGLTDSTYERWLVVKLSCSSWSSSSSPRSAGRWPAPTTRPRWRRAAVEESEAAAEDEVGALDVVEDSEPVPQQAPPALRRTVVFEIVGMGLILMATAGLRELAASSVCGDHGVGIGDRR